MALEEEPDDERPRSVGPLPPDDRLWRHPSELARGTDPPAAWELPRPVGPRRSMLVAALASACLAGAVVAVGVMWITRPTRVVVRETEVLGAAQTTAATYSAAVPTESLVAALAPSLVTVTVARGERWRSGTGIVLDDEGAVAVAASLVAGGEQLTVTGTDGRSVDARVTGSDDATGVALLAAPDVTGEPLDPTTSLAAAGRAVAVIGARSPDAEGTPQHRVVTASVSAVGRRSASAEVVLHDTSQLDRSVPDDAVGSVVVDAEGHLVGVVVTASDDDGMAVVAPADQVMAAAEDLRDDGDVQRAWLGVRATDLAPDVATLLDLPGGALLTTVEPGSPAAAGGLAAGDVITAVDGRSVADASDLVVSLRSLDPGDEVVVTWHRGRTEQRAPFVLGG